MNTIISEVMKTVEERGEVYGPAHINMGTTAALWSAFLGVKIAPAQVGICMILAKVARLKQTINHRDSLLDIAGYVNVTEDCINNGG